MRRGLFESVDTKHRVFISFHHKNDSYYKEQFEKDFKDLFINESVKDGEYDEDLSDTYIKRLIREEKISKSTVVVVLIGSETYKRKHVDWEIYAGLTEKVGGRSGLIGIILPTYYNNIDNCLYSLSGGEYNEDTIPKRLLDNVKTDFAEIYTWDYIYQQHLVGGEYYIKDCIESAFNRKNDTKYKIDLSRAQMQRNLN